MASKLLIVVSSGDHLPHTSHILECENEAHAERVYTNLRKSTEEGGVNGRDGIYYTVSYL